MQHILGHSSLYEASMGVYRAGGQCNQLCSSQLHRRKRQRLATSLAAQNNNGCGQAWVSQRVLATDEPVIVKTKQLMAGTEDVLSLAQGVVYWAPPESALDAAAKALRDPSVSSYGPCDGLPALVRALERKVDAENGLSNHRIMVTAGANQAFVNIVLTLLDATDRVVLFCPVYFNHRMALQMTGGADKIVYGRCDAQTLHPDLDWLEEELEGPLKPKMVVLINPCNPTGVLLRRPELERAAQLCKEAGAWLIMDNTYEHFVYGNREHVCVGGDHVLHLFSFSKAFGMMGWRTGYIAYRDKHGRLSEQLQKVQDTIPICPPQLSMHVALQATKEGRPWVQQRLQTLLGNREVLIDALSPLGNLGSGVAGGEGAIYLWARLPEEFGDDEAVVGWLVKEHGVCLIPGTSCGAPGYVRVAFGNLQPELCREAAARLKRGLQQLIADGLSAPMAEGSA